MDRRYQSLSSRRRNDLDRWLKDLEAGGDKAELSYAAVMALAEAGAPPEMTRELARLACIAVVDKKINQAGGVKGS